MALPNILKKLAELTTTVKNHISTKANGTNLGHVTLSDSTADSGSGVAKGIAATPKAVAAAFDKAATAQTAAATALSGHADDVASNTVLGHVKLSDAVNSTSGVSGGIAATPAAVKKAYDLAAAALPKAGGTMTGDLIMANSKGIVLDMSGTTPAAGTTYDIPLNIKAKNTTGKLTFTKSPFFTFPLAEVHDYGTGIGISASGTTIVGGGESARSIVSNLTLDGNTDKLILTSDTGIDIYVNGQDITKKNYIAIAANGNITAPGNISAQGSITATGGFVGNASSATKDAKGNTISEYLRKAELVSSKTAAGIKFTNGNGAASTVNIPAAAASSAGLITVGDPAIH